MTVALCGAMGIRRWEGVCKAPSRVPGLDSILGKWQLLLFLARGFFVIAKAIHAHLKLVAIPKCNK